LTFALLVAGREKYGKVADNSNQARDRAEDIDAVAELLHKSEGIVYMKVRHAGIEEGTENEISSSRARSET
jgi:hypothetical protein